MISQRHFYCIIRFQLTWVLRLIVNKAIRTQSLKGNGGQNLRLYISWQEVIQRMFQKELILCSTKSKTAWLWFDKNRLKLHKQYGEGRKVLLNDSIIFIFYILKCNVSFHFLGHESQLTISINVFPVLYFISGLKFIWFHLCAVVS